MNKLLIVEDIEALRHHVSAIVRDTMPDRTQVLEASNGTEALRLFQHERPNMVIMDILMRDVNGLKVAQQIWKVAPATKILFWSQFHREAYLRELNRIVPDSAIHGYALKGESSDKLRHAVLSVFVHHNPYIDPRVRQTKVTARDNSLSEVEYETLVDVMLGLTDRAIAARRSISVRGVQNRLASLLNKLVQKEHWALQKTAGMEIYNPRTRVIYEALKRGFITIEELMHFEDDLDEWLSTSINYRKHGNISRTIEVVQPVVPPISALP